MDKTTHTFKIKAVGLVIGLIVYGFAAHVGDATSQLLGIFIIIVSLIALYSE